MLESLNLTPLGAIMLPVGPVLVALVIGMSVWILRLERQANRGEIAKAEADRKIRQLGVFLLLLSLIPVVLIASIADWRAGLLIGLTFLSISAAGGITGIARRELRIIVALTIILLNATIVLMIALFLFVEQALHFFALTSATVMGVSMGMALVLLYSAATDKTPADS